MVLTATDWATRFSSECGPPSRTNPQQYLGSLLTRQFLRALCAQLDARHHYTTAYHTQANGLAERTKQTMKQILRAVTYEGSFWYDALPHAEVAMNNAALHASRWTPYYLNFGYHLCFKADALILIDLIIPACRKYIVCEYTYVLVYIGYKTKMGALPHLRVVEVQLFQKSSNKSSDHLDVHR